MPIHLLFFITVWPRIKYPKKPTNKPTEYQPNSFASGNSAVTAPWFRSDLDAVCDT
jgi:hypothetical protein